MTLAELKKRITNHDLTYVYADSGIEYERGNREYKAIMRAFKELDSDDKATIIDHWNKNVSENLVEDVRKDFEWLTNE